MRRPQVPVLLILLAVAASVVVALVALDRAAGVTRPHGRCCETEFIDAETLGLVWLLYPVLALAAAWSWRWALGGVVGIAVPQWVAMGEVMDRYAGSGWGDGLEVLGYLLPVQTAIIGAVAVLLGAQVGGGLRRRTSAALRRQGDHSAA